MEQRKSHLGLFKKRNETKEGYLLAHKNLMMFRSLLKQMTADSAKDKDEHGNIIL